MNNLELVDDAYEAKMLAFEITCNEGGGQAMACHNVGEFYSVVKEDHKRAAVTYKVQTYHHFTIRFTYIIVQFYLTLFYTDKLR
jgi:hypothetical protein